MLPSALQRSKYSVNETTETARGLRVLFIRESGIKREGISPARSGKGLPSHCSCTVLALFLSGAREGFFGLNPLGGGSVLAASLMCGFWCLCHAVI